MNTSTQVDPTGQQTTSVTPPVTITGKKEAKKEPPKIIERVIDSLEEFLTKPSADSKPDSKPTPKPQQQQVTSVQKSAQNPEEAQAQGSLGGSNEYVLPKGTMIKLPDGKEFETHTESKLSKA